MATDEMPIQDIDKLREWYKSLEARKTATEANLQANATKLESLKKQAREMYGTDNPDELRAKLDSMKTDNARKLTQYQQQLSDIEAKLAEIDRKYAEAVGKEAQS